MSATATATAEVIHESELGTLARIEDGNGVFTGLTVTVKSPASTPRWVELVRQARTRGYVGRLQPIDFYRNGSEGWVIYPAI
jgi:hypothetical protein